MSDDTTKTDGWGSEEASGGAPGSASPADRPQGQTGESQAAADRSGFCQDCGRPLTSATVRTVGTGVFCEPCLTARVGAAPPGQSYTAQGYAAPPFTTVPPQAAIADEPRPVLAAILGFIPGVGAMYNGQFAKGIVHLVIFAVLVSLSDDVNGIFGLFVAGWEFYMAFEAYHTAVARRDGLPLPNAFGFNDIGERMGFGKGWPAAPARPPDSAAPAASNQPPVADPVAGVGYVPYSTYPGTTTPDWVGYVPPTAFAGSSPIPPVPPPATPPSSAWSQAQYTETYTGHPQSYVPMPPERPDTATRRFPASALWLIGLGVLVLLANLLPDWRLTERWWPPILFACLAVWTFMRRMRSGGRLLCILRWPVLLLVLAVMLALHAAYFVVTTALTIAVLLITYGALLLLERAAAPGRMNVYPAAASYPPPPPPAGGADAQAEEAHSRAAWAAAQDTAAKVDADRNEEPSAR